MLNVIYAKCRKLVHYAECRYAECRGANIPEQNFRET
jgi:hypothetical protein